MISILKILDKIAKKQGIPRARVARLLDMKPETLTQMIAGNIRLTKHRLDQLIDFLELVNHKSAIIQWHERYKTYEHLKTITAFNNVDDVTLQAFASFIYFNNKFTGEEKRKINETILMYAIPHIESLPESIARIASDLYREKHGSN
jgi:plasmid maintenance system antidote protein VapI